MNELELKLKANEIRIDIIKMLNLAGTGHTAGPLGMSDIFTVLYFDILKNDTKKPLSEKRDFVFLSNGHICPVLYATLAHRGYFKIDELKTLRKLGSRLQGHPHYGALAGVENSGGPLGQGISQAVGLAVSLKRDQKQNSVYCFTGDGELEEGQVWEAFMYASKEKLDNLIVIVDRNHIQIDGSTEDVGGLFNLDKKFTSFGFSVIEFDGNNISQIKHAFEHALEMRGKAKPICLLANTTPGKGVSIFEGDYKWHGKTPNDEETKKAITELELIRKKLLGGNF